MSSPSPARRPWRLAEEMLPEGWRIERRGVISSTQDALRAELDSGRDIHGLVIRAEAQTQGKGRHERQWRSGAGGSYQSIGVRDVDGNLRYPSVPIAIAVAVAEALHPLVPGIALKWPNDLYLRESALAAGPVSRLPGKVGGILCQHLRGHLLIGVGINVRNEVPEEAAALTALEPENVSDRVLREIAKGVEVFDPSLPARYARFDLLAGRPLRIAEGQRVIAGRAAGVSAKGCLRFDTADGPTEICSGRIVEIDTAA